MNRRDAVAALVGLPSVTRIAKVADLKPDDVIVVECEKYIPREAVERITAQVQELWPGHKVAILCDGMKIKVIAGSEVPK
jgi:hypothetical protein